LKKLRNQMNELSQCHRLIIYLSLQMQRVQSVSLILCTAVRTHHVPAAGRRPSAYSAISAQQPGGDLIVTVPIASGVLPAAAMGGAHVKGDRRGMPFVAEIAADDRRRLH
jgi:hypothetical protein